MSSYKDLQVWQKTIELTQSIYQTTSYFPDSELYGLTSQIRRATVSMPTNIAERQKRGHVDEFIRFLRISYASGAELETLLIVAHKIGYLNSEQFAKINTSLQEIMKMLNKLIQSLQPRTKKLDTKNQKL